MAPHLPYFLASFTWNYGLGMSWLVVPLYAASRGLSGAEIGILFSRWLLRRKRLADEAREKELASPILVSSSSSPPQNPV